MTQNNTAVILAGGFGKRLKKITKNKLPKPIVEINGKPFLDYLLNHITKFKIKKIIIITSFLSEQIFKLYHQKKIKNSYIYCLKEKKPLGTGGALFLVKKIIKNKFILLNGDSIFKINLDKLLNIDLEDCEGICILTKNKNSETKKLNNLNIRNSRVILEKNKKKINSGVYIFSPKIFNYIKEKEISLEDDVLKKLILKKKIMGIKRNATFVDIGTPKTIKIAKKLLK